MIALIPARGGSKEVPRKNIRPLGGKPLIHWTIETVLRGENLEESVEKIINKNFYYVANEHTHEELKEIFLNTVAQHIPVIEGGFLVGIITEGNFSGLERNHSRAVLDNPVVIMAGGQGKRMDPITRILPKPLIPLGDDPMIMVVSFSMVINFPPFPESKKKSCFPAIKFC